MPPPDVALAHYRTQQQLAAKAVTAARHLWAGMRADDFDGSWRVVAPRMQALLTVAQARAAVNGAAYVPNALTEQGIPDAPDGQVDPAKLAGVASSGADLTALLESVVIRAKTLVLAGAPGPQALVGARSQLDGIMLTQVADAGRVASGVATVARAHIGYVRMLVRPSCSRCVVLAGKFYGPLAGFPRHPRCDCVHVPTLEDMAGDVTTDPAAYFQSLSAEQQDRDFTAAGAQAIRDGADINQVVNARLGVATASAHGRTVTHTTQGASRRSTFGKANPGRLRLMPEQIYKDATSRDDALRLLRHYGYLT
jgi:hypothetical protein